MLGIDDAEIAEKLTRFNFQSPREIGGFEYCGFDINFFFRESNNGFAGKISVNFTRNIKFHFAQVKAVFLLMSVFVVTLTVAEPRHFTQDMAHALVGIFIIIESIHHR